MAGAGVNIDFTPNRDAARELASTAEMRQFMQTIADEGAAEVAALAPSHVKSSGSITGAVVNGPDGFEAEIRVKSPKWHFLEFGTRNNSARPYIRPAAQALLSRYGGRFTAQ